MDKETVEKLAKLARIAISDSEAESLSKDLEKILEYVGEVKKAEGADLPKDPKNFPLRNVFRDDEYRKDNPKLKKELLENAPQNDPDYIKVKNIFND